MATPIQADPSVFFGSGIFVGAFCAAILALALVAALCTFVVRYASLYERAWMVREDGRIKVGAELHDPKPSKGSKKKGRLKPPGNGERRVPNSALS